MQPGAKPMTETCEQRIDSEFQSRMEDIDKLWTAYTEGDEERHADDLGTFWEYGLGFDYVAPDTFQEQPEGYFRWQLSYGGPSDEFRFFTNPDFSVHRIEYRFMDWFDGACREMPFDDNRARLLEIAETFQELGLFQEQFDRAMA
jgi:hypothetical protein